MHRRCRRRERRVRRALHLLGETIYIVVDGVADDAGGFTLDLDFVDPQCGNGVAEPGEECDDGDLIETNGCTTHCQDGPLCTAAAIPGGDRFETDPASGTCYVAFDDSFENMAGAANACVGVGGHLATIADASEQAFVTALGSPTQNQWLGGTDGAIDDSIFSWITGEPFGFQFWMAGEPDDDAGSGGDGECLAAAAASPTGAWMDTSCNFLGFVNGYICEIAQP